VRSSNASRLNHLQDLLEKTIKKKNEEQEQFLPSQRSSLLAFRAFPFFPLCVLLNNKGEMDCRARVGRSAYSFLSLQNTLQFLVLPTSCCLSFGEAVKMRTSQAWRRFSVYKGTSLGLSSSTCPSHPFAPFLASTLSSRFKSSSMRVFLTYTTLARYLFRLSILV